jgi:hypothetical protein
MTTQPLASGQQLFLQRLLAEHIMDDGTAQQVFTELELNKNNESLEESFQQINHQLTTGFGLEVATVVLGKEKYHSVINIHADDVAKQSFEHHFNPHEMALVRLVLQKLVGDDAASRADLMNLRGDLQDPYKLTLNGAEHVVEVMLEEHWLRIRVPEDAASQRRRESLQIQLELGPRTYLELSHYLVEMGIPQEDLPQFLFHRA